jgi:hypothetical protein
LTTLRVLRDSLDEDLREGAKRRLRDWGLTPQELLTLDPATLKPADLNALCERAAKQQAIARRQELEIEYCEEDNDEGDMLRRLVAQQLGHALFQYCDRKLKATAAYQRESETVGFWRAVARAPRKF